MADKDIDFVLAIGNPNNSGSTVPYEGQVKGYVWELNDSFEKADEIDGGNFSGKVSGNWDKFGVRGFLREFDFDGQVQVEIDGVNHSKQEALDYRPKRFRNGDTNLDNSTNRPDKSDTDKNRGTYFAIEGVNGGTDYTLTARSISKIRAHGGQANKSDKLNDARDRVRGSVGSGTDSYEYFGARSLNLNNPQNARVFVMPSDENNWTELTDGYRNGSSNGGSTDGPDSNQSEDGATRPPQNNTGSSDGSNNSSLSGDVMSYMAEPGDLQGALNDLHEDSGDGPGNERRSYVQLVPNATYDPGPTHIPRNLVLYSNGASIVPSSSYNVFTFDLGSQLVNPYINLRGVGDGNSYDARVFTFDPKNVTAGTDGRRGGYISTDAWKPRSGSPHNEYRFLENTRQNHFAHGGGVKGGVTLGNWRDNSTLFHYHQNQNDDGWHNSNLALFNNYHNARAVGYPVDIHSEGSKGYINSIKVSGNFAGFKTGVTIRGEETARKNMISANFQPQSGVSNYGVLIDNPTAESNFFEGCFWDRHKVSGKMFRVKRSNSGESWRPANNIMVDYTGHDSGTDGYFRDTSNGKGNKVVSLQDVYGGN